MESLGEGTLILALILVLTLIFIFIFILIFISTATSTTTPPLLCQVGLARAVYCDADVYLLDDPLAAVDAHVGQHLFEECISRLVARGKCVVLVTNALQVRGRNTSRSSSGRGSCKGSVG